MKRVSVIVGLALISVLLYSASLISENYPILDDSSLLRSGSSINVSNIEDLIIEQLLLGPRIPGSNGSKEFNLWVKDKIPSTLGWKLETQNFSYDDVELRNYWISTHNGITPDIIIGAHYDTRARANKDPNFPDSPVPGANDGGSGVAAILELINHIPNTFADKIGFALFDAEDQGSWGMTLKNERSWEWIVGSTEFVRNMSSNQINNTKAFILLDMIGDDDLEIPWEQNSDLVLIESIWGLASKLGYASIFVNTSGYSLIDDHFPFINAGIPSLDLIDFEYPEWHTTRDDIDAIDAENIAIVSDVCLEWLKNYFGYNESISTSKINSPPSISSNNSAISQKSETTIDITVIFAIVVIFPKFVNSNRSRRMLY